MLPPELLDAICFMVSQDSNSGRTLFALSLTSQEMNRCANTYIWQSIDNLRPLLNCMPWDLWSDYDVRKFKRKVVASDMSRFSKYSALVQSYGRPRQDWIESLPILKELWLANPFPSLLPNLRKVILSCQDEPEILVYMHALFGSHVTHLEVEIPNKIYFKSTHNFTDSYDCLIRQLLRKSPTVQHLGLPHCHHPASCDTILRNVLSLESSYLTSLRITLCEYTLNNVASISRLPFLQELDISFHPKEIVFPHVSTATSVTRSFPALRKLVLNSATFSACLHIIRFLKDTPLEIAYVDVTTHMTDGVGALYNQLRDGCRHETVKKVEVIEHRPEEVDDINMEVGPAQLRRLLSFRNMEHLDISGQKCHFTDQFLEDLAMSCPHISIISFTTWGGEDTAVTMRGLQCLAAHCRRLYSLEISFDACRLSEGLSTMKEPSASVLDYLNVVSSPIKKGTGRAVARLLRDMFPNLKRLGLRGNTHYLPDDAYREWVDVATILDLKLMEL